MRCTAFRPRWRSSSAYRAAAARATVGTTTEVWHFLRLLYVKLGTQHCVHDGAAVMPQSPESIAAAILKRYKGQHIGLLAPLVINRKGVYTELADWARPRGHTHLRVDGEFLPTTGFPRIDRFKEHTIELPVADGVVDPEQRSLVARAPHQGAGNRQGPGARFERAGRLGRGHGSGATHRGHWQAGGVFHHPRLPGLRHQLPRARSAPVLLQQQTRLVPRLRGHRAGADPRAAQGHGRLGARRQGKRPRAELCRARCGGGRRRALPQRVPARASMRRPARCVLAPTPRPINQAWASPRWRAWRSTMCGAGCKA